MAVITSAAPFLSACCMLFGLPLSVSVSYFEICMCYLAAKLLAEVLHLQCFTSKSLVLY